LFDWVVAKDILTATGAFIGTATGVFVLWDRYSRSAPLVFIEAAAFVPNGNNVPYLIVRNVASRPIIVELPTRVPTGYFRAARDETTIALVSSLMRKSVAVALVPSQTARFPLIVPGDFKQRSAHEYLAVSVQWRFALSRYFHWNRTVTQYITKDDFDAMMDVNN
jgi:hypothetical protein